MKVDCDRWHQQYQDVQKQLHAAPLKDKKPLRKRRGELLGLLREHCETYLKSKRLRATADGLVDIEILNT